MKHIRDILFLILCLGIGVGLVQGYRYWKKRTDYSFASKGDHIDTGSGDAPEARGFTLITPPAGPLKQLFADWQKLFVTTVGIQYSPAWTKEQLIITVKAAHGEHMIAVIVPPPVASEGNPYGRPLAEIAAEAQSAGADRLCISWVNHDPDPAYWTKQAEAVRAVYKGKIIFAATPEIFSKVRCWEVGDYVGIAGPIQLPRRLPHASDTMSLHDLRVAWDCRLTTFESIGLVFKRPVALLNVEVPRDFAVKLSPPEGPPIKPREDAGLQSNVYEALVTETKGRSERTDSLLLTWDGSARAVNQVSGLLPKIGAAWDPKKLKVAETAPDIADAPELDLVDPTATVPAQ